MPSRVAPAPTIGNDRGETLRCSRRWARQVASRSWCNGASDRAREQRMNYEIVGRVVESETGQGVSGVAISAFDRDPLFDDPLGEVLCDERGRFRIAYDERSFRDLFEKAPDVYVTVKTLDGKLLYTSRDATRKNASKHEEFEISLPRAVVD